MLLDEQKVDYSIKNIMDYWENGESLDTTLVDFIDSDTTPLDFSIVNGDYGQEKAEKFYDGVVDCNELSNRKYKELLTSLGFRYDNFDVQGISGDKLKILIDCNIIPMKLDNLQFIRENYSQQSLHLIKRDVSEYVSILTPDSFSIAEALSVLALDVGEDVKIALLSYTDEAISIVGKNYPVAVNAYILKNNLDANDLPKLFTSYDDCHSEMQTAILGLATQNMPIILSGPREVSKTLLNALFGNPQINRAQKVGLFVAVLPHLDKDDCITALTSMGLLEWANALAGCCS